jgi:hypothetical protein
VAARPTCRYQSEWSGLYFPERTNYTYNHSIMHSKYHFWKIKNSHLQTLFGLDVKRASEMLKQIRDAYGKSQTDDVRFFELCEHQKLNPEQVPLILGWEE